MNLRGPAEMSPVPKNVLTFLVILMTPLIVSFQVTRPVVVSHRGRTWLRPLRAALSHLVSCLPHRCVTAVPLSLSVCRPTVTFLPLPRRWPFMAPPTGWVRTGWPWWSRCSCCWHHGSNADDDDGDDHWERREAEEKRRSSGFQRCWESVVRTPVLTSALSWWLVFNSVE